MSAVTKPVSAAALVVGAAVVAVGAWLPVVMGPATAERTTGVMTYVPLGPAPLSVLRCAAGGVPGTIQIHDTYVESWGEPGAWPARLLLGSLLAAVGFAGARARPGALAASALLLLTIGWLFLAVGAPHVGGPPATGGPAAGWTAYPPLTVHDPRSSPLSNSWGVWALLAAGGLLVLASAWLRRAPSA
jgi:hypothetical protein